MDHPHRALKQIPLILVACLLLQGSSCNKTLTLTRVGDDASGGLVATWNQDHGSCAQNCWRTPSSFEVDKDATVELRAEPANAFKGWSGDLFGTQNPAFLGMNGNNKSVYAAFEMPGGAGYGDSSLKVQKERIPLAGGDGGWDVPPTASAVASCGTDCFTLPQMKPFTLVAKPDGSSLFSVWRGCEVANGRECTVTMRAGNVNRFAQPSAPPPNTVTAVFEWPELKVSLQNEANGSPKVTSEPSGIDCSATGGCMRRFPVGIVTLTAIDGDRALFSTWEGCSELTSDRKCKVSLNERRSVTAKFVDISTFTFTLTLKVLGGGAVKAYKKFGNAVPVLGWPVVLECNTDCGTKSVALQGGTEVLIEAIPDDPTSPTLAGPGTPGSHVDSWLEDCAGVGLTLPPVGTVPPGVQCERTMTRDISAGVQFRGN